MTVIPSTCISYWLPSTKVRLSFNQVPGKALQALLLLTMDPFAVPPTVIKNDDWSWSELQENLVTQSYDNVVISPGPGTPTNPKDIGEVTCILYEPVHRHSMALALQIAVHGCRYLQTPSGVRCWCSSAGGLHGMPGLGACAWSHHQPCPTACAWQGQRSGAQRPPAFP